MGIVFAGIISNRIDVVFRAGTPASTGPRLELFCSNRGIIARFSCRVIVRRTAKPVPNYQVFLISLMVSIRDRITVLHRIQTIPARDPSLLPLLTNPIRDAVLPMFHCVSLASPALGYHQMRILCKQLGRAPEPRGANVSMDVHPQISLVAGRAVECVPKFEERFLHPFQPILFSEIRVGTAEDH